MQKLLQKYKLTLYAGAFALMTLAPIGLYYTIQVGALVWTWILLGLTIFANLLILIIR